jgi:hypothetical protein
MTAIVTGHDRRPYLYTAVPHRPVYVADMPRITSAADQAHTGHAVLVAMLEPIQPGLETLAKVRLPSHRVIDVLARHLAEPAGLAARRILPARTPLRRALP